MKSAALCLIVAATLCLHGVAAAGVCAGRKDGTLLAAGTCSAVYYQCWKGKPVDTRATTCAKGLAFNPATKPLGCAEVGAVGLTDCNCNIYTGDKRQACRVCQARRKVYNYPMPGNPSKYVACTTQGAFPQPCNTGLKWNQKLQDCTR